MRYRATRSAGLMALSLTCFRSVAQTATPCAPNAPALACKLERWQSLLDSLAGLLAAILVVVVAGAVLIWRRVRAHDRREEDQRGPDRVIR